MNSPLDPEVTKFIQVVRDMSSIPEYHFPIVAAQHQYRARYAGMTSASMLEDLFFDTLVNYVQQHETTVSISRPPRGEKAYDYEFNQQKISHKVSKNGASVIAAVWDATRQDKTWSFESPISFTTGSYSSKKLEAVVMTKDVTTNKLIQTGQKFNIQPLEFIDKLESTSTVFVCQFGMGDTLEVLEIFNPDKPGVVKSELAFTKLWLLIQPHLKQVPVNEIELFVGNKNSTAPVIKGSKIRILSACYRPGTYVFRKMNLQNVTLEKNNRGLLVPKKTVASFMTLAVSQNDFIPMSNWFVKYVGDNPPDLYLMQKAEYNRLFSAYQPDFWGNDGRDDFK